MNLNDHANKSFMETVEKLPHDVYNFTQINALNADLLTDKAVLLVFKLKDGDETRSRWVPISQLRKDNHNEIWLANWLLTRMQSDGKND